MPSLIAGGGGSLELHGSIIVMLSCLSLTSRSCYGLVKKVPLLAVDKVEKTSIGYLFERYSVK